MEYPDLNLVVDYSKATVAEWDELNTPLPMHMLAFATDTGEFKLGNGINDFSDLDIAFTLTEVTEATAIADKFPDLSADDIGKFILLAPDGESFILSTLKLQELVTQETWDALVNNYANTSHDHDNTLINISDIDTMINSTMQVTTSGHDAISAILLSKMERDDDFIATMDQSMTDGFENTDGLDLAISRNIKVTNDILISNDIITPFTPPVVGELIKATAIEHNGKVYLFGGALDGTAVDTLHIYDTTTKTWSVGPTSPAARYSHSAAMIGNYMYVYGGTNGTSQFSDLNVFDTNTNTWTQLTGTAHTHHQGVLAAVDGALYAICGKIDDVASNQVHRYTPGDDTWNQLNNAPDTLIDSVAITVGTEVHVLGGYVSGGYSSSIWIYTAETDTWDVTRSLPITISQHAATLFDENTILMIGGRTGSTADVLDVMSYDVVTGNVVRLSDAIKTTYPCLITDGYQVHILGGTNTNGVWYTYCPHNGLHAVSKLNISTENIQIARAYLTGKIPSLNQNTKIEVTRDGANWAALQLMVSDLTIDNEIQSYSGMSEFNQQFNDLNIDLATIPVPDHKGTTTTFTVDTDNLYGHVNVALIGDLNHAKVITDSGNVEIVNIIGDGTSVASIVFNGTLAAGDYTITKIVKMEENEGKLKATQAYDPSTTSLTTGPTIRAYGLLFTYNDHIYQLGGYNGSPLMDLRRYEPEVDKWFSVTMTNTPTARYHMTGQVIDDVLIIHGGNDGSAILAETWKLDLVTMDWVQLTDGPQVQNHKSVVYNNEMYTYTYGGDVGEIWKVDTTGTWTKLIDDPTDTTILGASVEIIGSSIYTIGGYTTDYIATCRKYDIPTNTWIDLPDAPVSRANSVTMVDGERILLHGGNDATTHYDDLYIFDLRTNQWTTLDTALFGFTASGHRQVLLNGSNYVFGGYNGSTYLNVFTRIDALYQNPVNELLIVPINDDGSNTTINLIANTSNANEVFGAIKIGSIYQIYRNSIWREIARDNVGTWEYLNDSQIWISASANDERTALFEALAITDNQVTLTEWLTVPIGTLVVSDLAIFWDTQTIINDIDRIALNQLADLTAPSGDAVRYRITTNTPDGTEIHGISFHWA